MKNPMNYFGDERFLVPEKLLFFLHSQLKMKALEHTKKYQSWDGISEYLEFYFHNDFKEKYFTLFHLFNASGIGIKSGNVERAIKGKKGRQKANFNFEVSYYLLDFLCYAAWDKSLIETISGSHTDWGDTTTYSIIIPEYPHIENDFKNDSIVTIKDKTHSEINIFAKKIYIELITRKAAIPIDEKNDVIEEIYNSWYKLFCRIRDEMKTLPSDCLKDQENPDSVIGISLKILNEILRPHLTEHQAKFRSWIEKEKQKLDNKQIDPQKLQKKYPDYNVLVISLKEVNKKLMEITKVINRNM